MAEPEKRMRNGRVRWYARYYDPSGKRHSKAFDTAAEADRFLTTVKHSKLTGGYVDPNRSKVTVGAWADQWLDSKLNWHPRPRTGTRASFGPTFGHGGGGCPSTR